MHLPMFMMAYRSAVHETTGQTPFRLKYGHEMRMPVDLHFPRLQAEAISHRDYIFRRLTDASLLFEFVRDHCKTEQRRQKVYHDKKQHGPTYNIGDQVLLHTPVCSPGQTPKLKSFWSGPYLITSKINQINFVLENMGSRQKQIAHYDRIKPFVDSNQRFRSRRRIKRSDQLPRSEVDNDMVFLNCETNEAPSKASALVTPPSTSVTLPPAPTTGLAPPNTSVHTGPIQQPSSNLPLSAPSSSSVVSHRPRRNAAQHARFPGFYSLISRTKDDDAVFK